jgi:lipopolysaccharide export LptBFGC system permease protein LptF
MICGFDGAAGRHYRNGLQSNISGTSACETRAHALKITVLYRRFALEFLTLVLMFAAGWIVLRRPDRERLAFSLLVASVLLMVAIFTLSTRTSLLPGLNF